MINRIEKLCPVVRSIEPGPGAELEWCGCSTALGAVDAASEVFAQQERGPDWICAPPKKPGVLTDAYSPGTGKVEGL